MFDIRVIKERYFGDERTRKIGKNVIGLGVLQVVNVLISFLLVPIIMDFISPAQYGIWLTISSMVAWFSLLDIGLGTGMKNRLTEAIAKNDMKLAKEYVSTTYILLGIIVSIALLTFLFVAPFVNWANVYNQDNSMNNILKYTTIIVVAFFLLRLIIGLIGTVLTSYLKPAWSQAMNTFANFIVIVIIWILSRFMQGNLVILATILSASSAFVFFITSIVLYNGKYKEIKPSVKCFRKELIKSILGLGVNFFFINISMIIIFQANNFIIIHIFSNEDFVIYNLAYKLFSVCSILFGLISQPFWTAYTDAWVKGDVEWIKNTLRRIFKLWFLVVSFGVVMLCLSPIIYKIWIGDKIQIPFILSVAILAYFVSHTYGGVFNIFINGVGKIKLQVYCLLVVAIIYIPLVFLFIKVLNLGLVSIPLAQLISNFYSLFIARIQYNKLINGMAKGLWDK